jgi:hypothetical protein
VDSPPDGRHLPHLIILCSLHYPNPKHLSPSNNMKPKHAPITHLVALALILTAGVTKADHGRNFLLLQDTHISSPLRGTLHTGFDWNDYGVEEEMGLEVGGMLSVTKRVAFGANLSLLDESDGWEYASVTPYLLVDLTPKKSPVRIALFAGYEFGSLDAASDLDHGSEAAEHPHGSEKEHSHKKSSKREAGAEHEGSHGHSGIHRHGQSGLHARLIAEADLTAADKLVLNLINFTPEDGEASWGYAAGLRHSVNPDLAVGLEATGDFGDNNEHLLVAGGYFSLHPSLILKIGAGFGLTKESPDATVRLGAVLRF